jgi:hypothetical protein
MALLEAFVAESERNAELSQIGADVREVGSASALVTLIRVLCSVRTQISLYINMQRHTTTYLHTYILQCMDAGVLVVADLTDPLLSSDEANGIFQVGSSLRFISSRFLHST